MRWSGEEACSPLLEPGSGLFDFARHAGWVSLELLVASYAGMLVFIFFYMPFYAGGDGSDGWWRWC